MTTADDASTTTPIDTGPSSEAATTLAVPPRFTIVQRLGHGGMGVVFEAIDHEHGARVALKTLRTPSAEGLLRLKGEFRALQDLHHPNLVRYGELFEHDGRWFFSMERIEGLDWLAHVRTIGPDSRRTFDEEKLRDALAQLARGLVALHDAGKVHRDVKPSNVMVVARDARVVILDFGIVADAAQRDRWTDDDELVGTTAYMAPEQARAEPASAAGDWYSVGVLLYEALTGRVPYVGSMEEVLAAKQLVEPLSPRTLDPRAPRDLERLCLELLKIDPEQRPRGREVLERLRATTSETPPAPAIARDVFVGRARELATLRAAHADARAGRAVTVVAIGESGVGKSTLVRRFVDELGERALVFAGRCYERESVPYKAFDGIIDALARWLGTLDDAAPFARERALLARVFPVLRDGAASPDGEGEPEPDAGDAQVLRARVFSALRDLFARVAERAPVVALVDDLQWADADSVALLASLLAPPAPPILFVATMRAKDERVTRALAGDVRELAVKSLPRDDAEALVGALLEGTQDAEVGSAQSIAIEAAGHPLFIDEIVRARLHSRSRGAGEPTLGLDDALGARVDRLDAASKRVLHLVALAGAPLAQEIVARAAGEELATFAERVALLRGAHLVRTSGARKVDAVEPFHDRVRETVARRLAGEERRALHERLAIAIEASPHADPEPLAVHWRGAGDRAKALAYTRRAARRAGEALAFDRAAHLYATAIELHGADDADGAALRVHLGDALANASRGRDAASAYLAAADKTDAARALDLRRRAAEQLLRAGSVDEAIATFGRVLAEFDLAVPRTARGALAALLWRRAQVRLRGLAFDERSAHAIAPRDLLRVDACWMVGAGLGLVDTIVGSYFQSRGLLLALQAGEPSRVARALASEACFSSASGGPTAKRTASLVARAEAIASRIDDGYALAWSMGARGIAAGLEGRWREAYDACARAEQIFRARCTGVAWEIGQMRWFGLFATAYLGKIRELASVVPERLDEARARGDLHAEVQHITGLASFAWLAHDDPAELRARIRDVMARWSREKYHVEHWWATQAEAHANLYEGRGRAALDAIESRWKALEGSLLLMCQMTRTEAWNARGRAAIAAARDEPGRAREHLAVAERDARAIAKEKMPWSDPLAALLRGGVASTRGDRDAAIAHLDAAIPALDAQGMALWAACARWRRGERAASEAWMRGEGIARPERMVDVLAPWGSGDLTRLGSAET